MLFHAREFQFQFPRPAVIMGIVNVTPDSFSDGGCFSEPRAAIAHAFRLVDEGAEILDIGGESTRPNAQPVPEAEELRRVLPVLQGLAGRVQVPISIDTQKPSVARAALKAGACIVNDVGANRNDMEMWAIVAEARAGYVAMHMQGTPQTMQLNPTYTNVAKDVAGFFEERLGKLRGAGVAAEQVVLDVGIGFGKTLVHNLELLRQLKGFTKLRRPLLLGVSRKSFLERVAGSMEVSQRLPAALACTGWAVQQGVNIIRTHDVAPTLKAVRMVETLLARPA